LCDVVDPGCCLCGLCVSLSDGMSWGVLCWVQSVWSECVVRVNVVGVLCGVWCCEHRLPFVYSVCVELSCFVRCVVVVESVWSVPAVHVIWGWVHVIYVVW